MQEGFRSVAYEDFLAEVRKQGVPSEHIAYKCCVCGTIQSGMSLIRAGAGKDFAAVSSTVGFSCVGRFTGAGSHKKGTPPGRGCNYTLGGLFKLNTYEVVKDGEQHPLFEPATPAEAKELLKANRILGHVDGKPVFKGDVLYVDIRGTCEKQWGKGLVASQGANEGQGPMIVFENGDYRMTDRLLWNPVITVTIPPEILAIGRNIKSQDKRSTSHPMFQIQQEVEIVAYEDHNECRIVWRENLSGDYEEATPLRATRLEALYQARDEEPEGWNRYTIATVWQVVTSCFTKVGADEYLRAHGRDLKNPRIYVASGWNNTEFKTVRDFLLSIVPEAQ